ncbi:MAG: hypothetical protein UFG06_07500 [Lachnospiraceae bacterium]|nr:hypothetical protein [Lachnospiraceae bacterium]
MHIAICDDNVADRKQLERLLKRESDKRAASTGVLYIDSYGHPESLLKNSMQYDVFFVDICRTDGLTGTDVINSLTAQGNSSPVILCSSLIPYRTQEELLPERVLFLDKPIKAAELSSLLDEAQKIKDSAVPVIELREDKGTLYVTEPDILYAVEEGRHLVVTLKSGQTVMLTATAMNFFSQVENFPVFFAPNLHAVVNGRHIDHIRFHKIIMCNGTVFKAFGQILSYAKHIYADTR